VTASGAAAEGGAASLFLEVCGLHIWSDEATKYTKILFKLNTGRKKTENLI